MKELVSVKLELEFEIDSSEKALYIDTNGEPTTGLLADTIDVFANNDIEVSKINNLSRAEIQAKLNAEAGI